MLLRWSTGAVYRDALPCVSDDSHGPWWELIGFCPLGVHCFGHSFPYYCSPFSFHCFFFRDYQGLGLVPQTADTLTTLITEGFCGVSYLALSWTCTGNLNYSPLGDLWGTWPKLEDFWENTLLKKTDSSSISRAPCGFQGCKNRPAPFPVRMSYQATKPGLVCLSYLSMLYYVLWTKFTRHCRIWKLALLQVMTMFTQSSWRTWVLEHKPGCHAFSPGSLLRTQSQKSGERRR